MVMKQQESTMKRANSVSPQGWSSEEDQPLDFSRNNASAESSPKKSDSSSPIDVAKIGLSAFPDIKPFAQSPAVSEKSDELRPGFVPVPQALRFQPTILSPITPALSPELLSTNLNALYNFAYTSPDALQAPNLLDPRYLHFRQQQQALLQTMQHSMEAQRRRSNTQSSSTPSPVPKSNERSSELSDTDDQVVCSKKSKDGGSASSRKRGRAFPDELKDDAYWERRRKNNEAAKRSRDARRAKEDEIAIRASFLERENFQLRTELNSLKDHLQSLGCAPLYTP